MARRPNVHVHPRLTEAAKALAHDVARIAAACIAQRGRFAVALSGGATPAALYAALASPPLAQTIDWGRWHVFWGDERCVPHGHADSNAGMAQRTLLDHVAVPKRQVHRMAGEDDPEHAARAYEALLERELPRDAGGGPGRLDLALLGVGEDGHTASLFPGTVALAERERAVTAVWVAHLGAWRLTMTVPALSASRHVAVLAAGDAKADAVRRALSPRPGDATPPVALVQPAECATIWHIDRAAARDLPPERQGQA